MKVNRVSQSTIVMNSRRNRSITPANLESIVVVVKQENHKRPVKIVS